MPGQPLPREVVEWIFRKKAIAAAAVAPVAETPVADADADAAEGVGEVSVLATSSPRGVIFLVHGRPSRQPSALASSISAKFWVPAFTIHDIVAESITSGSERGLALVASLEAAAKAAAAPVDFGTVRVSDKPVEQILLLNKGLYMLLAIVLVQKGQHWELLHFFVTNRYTRTRR
jgi:hypothetical protein